MLDTNEPERGIEIKTSSKSGVSSKRRRSVSMSVKKTWRRKSALELLEARLKHPGNYDDKQIARMEREVVTLKERIAHGRV